LSLCFYGLTFNPVLRVLGLAGGVDAVRRVKGSVSLDQLIFRQTREALKAVDVLGVVPAMDDEVEVNEKYHISSQLLLFTFSSGDDWYWSILEDQSITLFASLTYIEVHVIS